VGLRDEGGLRDGLRLTGEGGPGEAVLRCADAGGLVLLFAA
jgi:hypothetical protein